jgi:hypothetical protein
MKKIFLFLASLACMLPTADLYAQNGDPSRVSSITWNDTTVIRPKQKGFAIGFQWGPGVKTFNEFFKANAVQTTTGIIGYPDHCDLANPIHPADDYYSVLPDTCDVTMTVETIFCGSGPNNEPQWGVGGSDRGLHAAQSMAIQFDPVAPVGNPVNFTPNTSDSTGAVFGFGYKNTSIVSQGGARTLTAIFLIKPASHQDNW